MFHPLPKRPSLKVSRPKGPKVADTAVPGSMKSAVLGQAGRKVRQELEIDYKMRSVARGRGSSTVASKGLRMASRSLGADKRVKTMT